MSLERSINYYYAVMALWLLLERGLISEEEYGKICRYNAEVFQMCIRDRGNTVYEPFRFRTFRFVQVTVKTGKEPLTILPQPYVETAYPLENTKKPVFTDPKKEKLYDTAFRTLQLCAHDTYEDRCV